MDIVVLVKSSNFRRGFAAMIILVLFVTMATLLMVGMKVTEQSMIREADTRAHEDLQGLKRSIRFLLSIDPTCGPSLRKDNGDQYTIPDLNDPGPNPNPNVSTMDKNENILFPADPIELGSIKSGSVEIIKKGSRYRSFLVDRITLEDEDPTRSVLQTFLKIRADVLKLTLFLSRTSVGGRTQSATLEFKFNNYFRLRRNPLNVWEGGGLNCSSIGAVGFDRCVIRPGDTDPGNIGAAHSPCAQGETLTSGGGYCMNMTDRYVSSNGRDTVSSNPNGSYIVVNKARDSYPNQWRVMCKRAKADGTREPMGDSEPARAIAICCQNDLISITNN